MLVFWFGSVVPSSLVGLVPCCRRPLLRCVEVESDICAVSARSRCDHNVKVKKNTDTVLRRWESLGYMAEFTGVNKKSSTMVVSLLASLGVHGVYRANRKTASRCAGMQTKWKIKQRTGVSCRSLELIDSTTSTSQCPNAPSCWLLRCCQPMPVSSAWSPPRSRPSY